MTDGLNQLEEVILAKIQQRIHSRTTEETFIAKALKHHDLTNVGWLDLDKFRRTMAPYTAGLADQDIQAIFNRYSQDGVLPIRQFAAEFSSGYRRAMPQESTVADTPNDEQEKYFQQRMEAPEDTLDRMKDFLYEQGPRAITSLAASFRDADPQNVRILHFETYMMVTSDFFQEMQVSDDQLISVFSLFRQPHAPDEMAYDEFFLALKEEPSAQRRAVIRQAWRRLDTASEGLADINKIVRAFNANRHPAVSAGTRSAEEVLEEFVKTLEDHIGYRRGQRSYPTNLVAWEEFEDYYKMISGCFVTDDDFCNTLEKVWDLNKLPDASVDQRVALARPAAGAPAKSRAGLHHWQTNTLPTNPTHHKVEHCTRVEDVLLRARTQIARKGIRAAVDIVQNFYAADDDVDDAIDVYEFRQACQRSGLAFRDAEEASIFNACGTTCAGKINVPRFLQLLHGELSQARRTGVERAFKAVGGNPEDPSSRVSPATLKAAFAAEVHPLVAKGQFQPGYVLAEFLDTFSQLAHVVGGCENGMVSFVDFLTYYEVVSSTIDNDTLFDLILQRVWDVPAKDGPGPDESAGEGPISPRRSIPNLEHPASPMAEPRPPAHSGPSAYARTMATTSTGPSLVESHRRFGRSDGTSMCSPITKSSIVFDQTGQSGLDRLRKAVVIRGLKGWKSLVERFLHFDYKRNGTVMRQDWLRMNKMLGFGLAPEEQEQLFRALSGAKKGVAMDYEECLRLLRGDGLSEERAVAVEELYQALGGGQPLPAETLKNNFDARCSPQVLLRGAHSKDVAKTEQEFFEAVDFFSNRGVYDAERFAEFFSMASAVHEDDDEFRLMTSSAFGLS